MYRAMQFRRYQSLNRVFAWRPGRAQNGPSTPLSARRNRNWTYSRGLQNTVQSCYFEKIRYSIPTPNQGVYCGGGSATTSAQSTREMRPFALVVREALRFRIHLLPETRSRSSRSHTSSTQRALATISGSRGRCSTFPIVEAVRKACRVHDVFIDDLDYHRCK